jgi:hypothetical protein
LDALSLHVCGGVPNGSMRMPIPPSRP